MAKTELRHTCNPAKPGQALPFGKPDPTGECLRCAERAVEREQGIPAREPHPRIQWGIDRRRHNNGYPTDAERERHFRAGGPHATGKCGPVCTFGEW